MARSQYQYHPLTGPVWTAPVAESLAWLPEGQQQLPRALPRNQLGAYVPPFSDAVAVALLGWLPAGSLAVDRPVPNRLGFYVEPFVEAIDTARELGWFAQGVQPLPPERRRFDWGVLAPFQPPVSYDGSLFPWPSLIAPRLGERRGLGDSVEPFLQALYQPSGLQWIPEGRERGPQALGRSAPTWIILDPFPRAATFDPASLSWMPSAPPLLRRARQQGKFDWTEAVAGIYDPAGMDWHILPPRPWPLARRQQTWSLLSPLPITVSFDPALLQWLPYFPALQRQLERSRLGTYTLHPLPPADAFNPAHLAWLPYVPFPQRQLLVGRLGASVLYPLPPADAFDAALLEWLPYVPFPPCRLQVGRVGAYVLDVFPRPTVFDAALFPVIQTVIYRVLPRALRGDWVEPFVAALYRPEFLQWIPLGRQPWRGLPPNALGILVTDPSPPSGLPGYWIVSGPSAAWPGAGGIVGGWPTAEEDA